MIFKIEETDKYFVNKINIFGNNVTEESVIRNRLEIDEGDPYNEILVKKSINNIQNLNFFRSVKEKTVQIDASNKIINIYVEEKPTEKLLEQGMVLRAVQYFYQFQKIIIWAKE